MNNFFKKRKNTMSPSKNGNIEFILSIENSVPHAEAKEPFLVVKRAIDVIPEWYRDLSPLVDINGKPDLSLKKCIPFLDAINTGYFLVTAKDYTFRSDKEKEEYFFSGSIEQSQHKDYPVLKHPIEQVGDMPFGQEFIKYAFKWNNQYIIGTHQFRQVE